MDNAKPIRTSMSTLTKLDVDDGGNKVDVTLFRGIIVSLLYLTTSRPNIMFSVCMCTIF